MATRSTRFAADFEADEDGYYYSVDHGELRGPFPDQVERSRDLLRVLVAWGERARALGGSLYRETDRTWVVTLPVEHVVTGGEVLDLGRRAA